MAEKPRLKIPKEAKKGEVIEIKTLLPHVMESGQRKDKDGKTIPRKIINKLKPLNEMCYPMVWLLFYWIKMIWVQVFLSSPFLIIKNNQFANDCFLYHHRKKQ